MRATQSPHSRHPGRRRQKKKKKKKKPWQEDRGPICLFQSISSPTMEGPCSKAPLPKLGFPPFLPLPSSKGCTDENLSSKISSLPKPRAEQWYRNLFLLLSSYFCFCHHRRSVWVLSLSQVLFIFSRSLKSLYVLPRAGLRNNQRFLSE